MWNLLLAILTMTLTLTPASHAQTTDHFTLGNEPFAVEVLVEPYRTIDFPEGYRPRFDQTALVRQVTLEGKTFLHNPFGLIDEFGILGKGVLGYDQAENGETFLKIGVGTEIRDPGDEGKYKFSYNYKVAHAAPVKVVSHDDHSLTLEQSASLGPWGYHYVKRYVVDPDKATLRIEYALTNIGKRAFPFEQYNHDWLHFKDAPIGPGYTLTAGFSMDPLTEPAAKWLKRDGGTLKVIAPVTKNYFPSTQGSPTKDNHFIVRYSNGQSVTVEGDFAVDRFALYADPRAFCPEVFFSENDLKPGKTVKWTRTYRFAVGP